jgi:hypothetical protein
LVVEDQVAKVLELIVMVSLVEVVAVAFEAELAVQAQQVKVLQVVPM